MTNVVEPGADAQPTQRPVRLPDGVEILDNGPVVVIGPNGSGKSRRSRQISSDENIEVISALRNTRISQQLQPITTKGMYSWNLSSRPGKSSPQRIWIFSKEASGGRSGVSPALALRKNSNEGSKASPRSAVSM